MVYSVQEVLYLLESYGVYDHLLPFFLLFAFIFSILSYTDLFGKNKGVTTIISLVIGLMAVRFPFFTQFYAELFPRLGIGAVVLLTILILVGLFTTKFTKALILPWIFFGSGIIILITILYQSFDRLGWIYGVNVGSEVVGWIIVSILLIAVLVTVIISTRNPDDEAKKRYEEMMGHWVPIGTPRSP